MNWKQNKGFLLGVGCLGTLFAGLSTYGFLTSSAKGEVESALQSKLAERQSMENDKIFPSMENVRSLGGDVSALQGFLTTLQDDIRRRQSTPMEASNPSDFNLLLESERNALLKQAASAKVEVPGLEGEPAQSHPVSVSDKFWFDFDEYGLGGKTPELAQIPVLSVQLKTLKAVCEALIRAGASEIGPVERQKLETQVAAQPEAAEAAEESQAKKKKGRKTESESLATVKLDSFTCGVRFSAREDLAWKALTAAANLPLPLVITGVEVRNLNSALQPAFGGAGSAAVATSSSLDDLAKALGSKSSSTGVRLETAGTEMVQVQIRFRVYQITTPAAPSPADPKPQGS